ncbi:vam6/Vps39-like protein [Acanthaster planci]|uniref:Vam6/Vps39-like protein n=1 Tax=Acanthaster planci TaxID=133434 RepID=A0A8B7YDH9_ACAPL|nr:vam6/Vps39-like protein [Acanthaster planci]
MHDAYEERPILEKLPLQIESIACHGDQLLVGTKQGHLLVYSVTAGIGNLSFKVDLLKSFKSFSKRPIQQLACIPELQILISLSDAVINVHDLNHFSQITSIAKTKGATLFAIDLQKLTTESGSSTYNLRLCVAVKRKLQLFYWKNRSFEDVKAELGVPDVPKAMAWCGSSLCVGFKRDYFLIRVDNGELKDLFTTGNATQAEPTVTRLSEDMLALGRDMMSIIIDSEGQPAKKYALTWSDFPIVLEHDQPYIIAVLPKYVEIRTVDPRLLVQTIELNKPRSITIGSGHVYVASQHYIWRLVPIPITTQIKALLADKQFELALHLANMTDEVEADKQRRIQHIQNLYAFELFQQHRFEESMKMFSKLGTDPSQVIGLFPDLLPKEYRSKLEYPSNPTELTGQAMEKGLTALIEYLTQKRQDLMKASGKELNQPSTIVEGCATVTSRKQMSLIIDTTLLKCYLQTNDALVAPLLRLKDNNCHLEESERVLKKHQKYGELIILYEKRGLHRKALDLLLRQSQKPNSPLKGHERTVAYLQRLGHEHMDTICEYAKWVLKAHPEDGLKIFTEDIPEVESLPRIRVLDYLMTVVKRLTVPYLEHVILTCGDTTPEFHNRLIHLYREMVQEKMADYLHTLPEGQLPPRAGTEPGEFGELRRKLLFFLETSSSYIPERLLTHFPFDGFYEERALLLGRLGRHEQALAIYAHVLKDTRRAEEYCRRNYARDPQTNKDVYLSLFKTYIKPPDASSLRIMASIEPSKPNIKAALEVLQFHHDKVDTARALEMLPETIQVSDVCGFLEGVLETKAKHRRNNQILKSLFFSENLQVREQHIHYQSQKCVITEERNCPVCKKRMGNSAFARYPNGVVVHYYCAKDRSVCPVEPT